MEIDWIDLGLKLAAIVISIAAMIVAWVRTRREDVDRRFEGTHTKLIDHDRRIQRLEDTGQSLPTKDELHAISLQLAALNGTIGVIHSDLAGHGRMLSRVENVVGRHEAHLLKTATPEPVRG